MKNKYNIWLRISRQVADAGGGGGAGAGGETTPAPSGGVGSGGDSSPPAASDVPPSLLSAGGVTPPPAAGNPEDKEPPAAAPPAPEAPPLTLEALTLPEGLTLSDEQAESFLGIFNNAELDNAGRANALLETFGAQIEANVNSIVEESMAALKVEQLKAWDDMNVQWLESIKDLPEFKNDPEATIGEVKQALTSAGATEDFFLAMSLTGAGNNPHILQLLHKLSRPYVEGGGVGGGGAVPKGNAALNNLYPSMRKA